MAKAKLISNKTLYREIAVRFKYIRQLLGISIKTIAQELDIDPEDISDIEKGNISKNVFYPVMQALGTNYGVNSNFFINESGLIFKKKGHKIKDSVYQELKDLYLDFKHKPLSTDTVIKTPK